MLRELDFPVVEMRDEFARLQEQFIAAVDPWVKLFFALEPKTADEQGFAIRQLLVRAINDVVAAFHLLCHGYLNQAYNTMRMAYEGCELLELLGSDPDQAELWVNSKKPWRDFSPRNVRDKLGKDGVDEVYSQLCAYAHPRFEGSRLTGYSRRPANQPDADHTHILRLGPFLIDDHPAIGFAAGFLGSTVAYIGLRASHLALTGAVTADLWEQALRRSMAGVAAYLESVTRILIARGVPEQEARFPAYDNWREVLDRDDDTNPG